jgi:hypothetical protein
VGLRSPCTPSSISISSHGRECWSSGCDSNYQLPLESVRKHQAGLQSFRSMRRIEARRRNASALRLRFSQSLASLRQRLSQANVRSIGGGSIGAAQTLPVVKAALAKGNRQEKLHEFDLSAFDT